MALGELVVVSPFGWSDGLWDRSHHLASRLAEGRRTWFVEPPVAGDGDPVLEVVEAGPVTRLRWVGGDGGGLDDPSTIEAYAARLEAGPTPPGRTVLLATPLGLELARRLAPAVLAYDIAEDGPRALGAGGLAGEAHQAALRAADVVFTAGSSLHQAVLADRPDGTHLVPNGVEPEHFREAAQRRRPARRPVAGHLGPIDERLDLDLLEAVAIALPAWDIRLTGPVDLDPARLPSAPNVHVEPCRPYAELPGVMVGIDVAVQPFAPAANRTSCPARTLEYLAAGLPVVSTPVPDVVADFDHLVDVQADPAGFAEACERVREDDVARRMRKARPVLHRRHWDTVAARVERLMTAAEGVPA